MRQRVWWWCVGVCSLMAGASTVRADVLTAERAVQIALKRNTSVIQAEAGVLDARGELYDMNV